MCSKSRSSQTIRRLLIARAMVEGEQLSPPRRSSAQGPLPAAQFGQPHPPIIAEGAVGMVLALLRDPDAQTEAILIGVRLRRRSVPILLDVLRKSTESVVPPSSAGGLCPSGEVCKTPSAFLAFVDRGPATLRVVCRVQRRFLRVQRCALLLPEPDGTLRMTGGRCRCRSCPAWPNPSVHRQRLYRRANSLGDLTIRPRRWHIIGTNSGEWRHVASYIKQQGHQRQNASAVPGMYTSFVRKMN